MIHKPLVTPIDFSTVSSMLSQDGDESTVLISPSKQRLTRKVRFSSLDHSVSRPMEVDDAKNLWYKPQDISTFKKQARKQFLASQKQHRNSSSPVLDTTNVSNQETFRGLEACSFERQLWKHRTNQSILSSYKKGMTSEETAQISRTCTAWNEEVAFLQACHDYCSVYGAASPILLPMVPNKPPEFPFQLKRVKTDDEDSATSRTGRVRRRTI